MFANKDFRPALLSFPAADGLALLPMTRPVLLNMALGFDHQIKASAFDKLCQVVKKCLGNLRGKICCLGCLCRGEEIPGGPGGEY